jgi:ribose transport system permease protein
MAQTTHLSVQDTQEPTLWRRVSGSASIGSLAGIAVFVLVFIFFSVRAPGFLSVNNLVRSLLMPASIAAVIALGMMVVMTGGGIDLSVSATAGLSALLAAVAAARLDVGLPLMLLIAMLGGLLVGALNGVFVAYIGVSPFVVTLSVVFLAEGLQFLVTLMTISGTYLMLPRDVTRLATKPWFLLGLCALVSVTTYILLDRTIYGRYIRAVGQNLEVARFSGIPVRFYTWLTYAICGVLASIAGLMLTSVEGMARTGSGESYLIDAFLVPILGQSIFGRFSVQGTLFGALFMYMIIDGLFILGTPPESVRIVKGALLLAVILVSGLQKMRSSQ